MSTLYWHERPHEDFPDFVDLRRTRVRKSRREHKCRFCGRSIEKGQPYIRQVFLEDGKFYSVAMHDGLNC